MKTFKQLLEEASVPAEATQALLALRKELGYAASMSPKKEGSKKYSGGFDDANGLYADDFKSDKEIKKHLDKTYSDMEKRLMKTGYFKKVKFNVDMVSTMTHDSDQEEYDEYFPNQESEEVNEIITWKIEIV